ncbi:MAG: S-layer [Bacteroidetes bacterium]|nr:MAG: S-layer [Bacteroidota bacterium]
MNFLKLLTLLLLIGLTASGQSIPAVSAKLPEKHCLNEAEQQMASAINQYRKKQGLKAIPLSTSLSWVARTHVTDLSEHYEYGTSCNLHSWSENPAWSSCCYGSDHSQAACMWDKPRELTQYKGDGFEIAFYSTHDYSSTQSFVDDAIEGWKKSRGHHEVMMNRGKWKTATWEAMGIGANDQFIVVWFGEVKDAAGSPEICR